MRSASITRSPPNTRHIITGSREEYDLMEHIAGDSWADKQTAERWFAENAEIIIIKHGSEGSMAYVKGGDSYRVHIVPVNMLEIHRLAATRILPRSCTVF